VCFLRRCNDRVPVTEPSARLGVSANFSIFRSASKTGRKCLLEHYMYVVFCSTSIVHILVPLLP
jgi:hypothetical protein